ncbi:MAG TPA: hypothetical protein VG271_15885, partial [Beijerinckiaceae bacterium]|nr:hypothetical protein [Beijerinckiaceae bacterium]
AELHADVDQGRLALLALEFMGERQMHGALRLPVLPKRSTIRTVRRGLRIARGNDDTEQGGRWILPMTPGHERSFPSRRAFLGAALALAAPRRRRDRDA